VELKYFVTSPNKINKYLDFLSVPGVGKIITIIIIIIIILRGLGQRPVQVQKFNF
jgi:hypothetical protein